MHKVIPALGIFSLVNICSDTRAGSCQLVFKKCLFFDIIVQVNKLYRKFDSRAFQFSFFHDCEMVQDKGESCK